MHLAAMPPTPGTQDLLPQALSSTPFRPEHQPWRPSGHVSTGCSQASCLALQLGTSPGTVQPPSPLGLKLGGCFFHPTANPAPAPVLPRLSTSHTHHRHGPRPPVTTVLGSSCSPCLGTCGGGGRYLARTQRQDPNSANVRKALADLVLWPISSPLPPLASGTCRKAVLLALRS